MSTALMPRSVSRHSFASSSATIARKGSSFDFASSPKTLCIKRSFAAVLMSHTFFGVELTATTCRSLAERITLRSSVSTRAPTSFSHPFGRRLALGPPAPACWIFNMISARAGGNRTSSSLRARSSAIGRPSRRSIATRPAAGPRLHRRRTGLLLSAFAKRCTRSVNDPAMHYVAR